MVGGGGNSHLRKSQSQPTLTCGEAWSLFTPGTIDNINHRDDHSHPHQTISEITILAKQDACQDEAKSKPCEVGEPVFISIFTDEEDKHGNNQDNDDSYEDEWK